MGERETDYAREKHLSGQEAGLSPYTNNILLARVLGSILLQQRREVFGGGMWVECSTSPSWNGLDQLVPDSLYVQRGLASVGCGIKDSYGECLVTVLAGHLVGVVN